MAKTLAIILGVILVLLGLLGFISNPLIGVNSLFATDGVHVYSEERSAKAELVSQADPATFIAIRASYQIPYAPNSGKYGQSFMSYDLTYEKDKSHVYDKGRLVPGADPNTFVVLGDAEMFANPTAQNFILAKDAYHTYGEDAKGNITVDGIIVH